MQIALHNLATQRADLPESIRIARETGYAGIEIDGTKLRSYLAGGHSIESLREQLCTVPPVGLSYVKDIERQRPAEYQSLLTECDEVCRTAQAIGSPMVQVLTGPLDPSGQYQGLIGTPWPEIRSLTAKNLRALAAIAKSYGIKFYLEAICFTPLCRLEQQLELIEAAACDNVGLVLDFYHLWDAGTRPEEIARLNKDLIYCVDFCDSSDPFGAGGDPRQLGRDIWTGAGRIPLQEWVDAVRATGFDGVWRCELLSPRYWKLDPWKTAGLVKK